MFPQSVIVWFLSPQEKVQAYAKISERMTISQDSMTLYDAESPPIAYHMEEAELASDVENLLTQVLVIFVPNLVLVMSLPIFLYLVQPTF